MPPRLLVIEDELLLAESLKTGLESEGFSVAVANDGEDGYFRILNEPFDLVVLDWMLPGRDGITVLGALRDKHIEVPVLLLTARDSVQDRVTGLETGADDYLVKPFAFPELTARIRALLRRTDREGASTLRAADLTVDVVHLTVERAGKAVDLTSTELKMLIELLRHKDHIVSREMLAEAVWGDGARATPMDNVLDVHLSRLRKKVDHPFAHRLIETVRGVGFRILDVP
jgi:two-component system copper resistance phosphate regulon response regulator CusR